MRILKLALLVAASVVPISCSSGSDYGSPLTISEQNAEPVASQGVMAVGMVMEMGSLAEGMTDVIETGAQSIPCDSGNLSVDINDQAPLETLSTGDSVTFTFNACVINQGGLFPITLNGSMTITATEVVGDEGGPFSLVVDANFSSLTVVLGGGAAVVDGGFTVDVSSQDGETVVSSISGERFSAFAQGGGEAFSGTIADFDINQTVNETTGDFSVSVNATVSGVGGAVTFETPTPFTGNGDSDPSQGTMIITGADDGSITLNAVDAVNVELVVDVDGDGTPEATIQTTWDVLDPDDEEV